MDKRSCRGVKDGETDVWSFGLALRACCKSAWAPGFLLSPNRTIFFIPCWPQLGFPLIRIAGRNMKGHWKTGNNGWLKKHGKHPIFYCLFRARPLKITQKWHRVGHRSEDGSAHADTILTLFLNTKMDNLKQPVPSLFPSLVWNVRWWLSHILSLFSRLTEEETEKVRFPKVCRPYTVFRKTRN